MVGNDLTKSRPRARLKIIRILACSFLFLVSVCFVWWQFFIPGPWEDFFGLRSIAVTQSSRPGGMVAVCHADGIVTDSNELYICDETPHGEESFRLARLQCQDENDLPEPYWSKDRSLVILRSDPGVKPLFDPASRVGYEFSAHAILGGISPDLLQQRGGLGTEVMADRVNYPCGFVLWRMGLSPCGLPGDNPQG